MKKMKTFNSNSLTPESLIGTKWIAVNPDSNYGYTIEIVEKTYCIITSPNKVKLQTYKISEDQIFINNSISYAIRDNTFLLNDIPLYIKE
jgi:hypothetical protein